MESLVIDAINAIPDAVRFAIFPLIRLVATFFGLTLWEDGSVG